MLSSSILDNMSNLTVYICVSKPVFSVISQAKDIEILTIYLSKKNFCYKNMQ